MKKFILFMAMSVMTFSFGQTTITQWDFEGEVITPSVGSGTASLVGGTTSTFAAGVGGSPNRGWNTTSYQAQGSGSGTAGVEYAFSTLGFQDITITYDQRSSGTASRWLGIYLSTDGGVSWNLAYNNNGGPSPHDTFYNFSFDLSAYSIAVNNTSDVRVRILSIFSPLAFNQNASLSYGANEAYMRANAQAQYPPSNGVGAGNYSTGGTVRYDNVTISGTEIGAHALRNDFCNQTLADLGTNIYVNSVSGAQEYTFEVTAPDNSVTEVVSPRRWFNLITAGFSPNYEETYSIRVKVKVADEYNNYGVTCTVTTPDLPVATLRSEFCDVTIASLGTQLIAEKVKGASEFTFEVTNMSTMSVDEVVSTNRWFNLVTADLNPTNGTVYSIKVKVQINGDYGDYGPACTVTTPEDIILLNGDMSGIEASTTAYPNPFTNQFTVRLADLTTANIQVFDINGRLVENLTTNDTFEVEMGQNLNAGVYLVRVEQNGDNQSFKMIKK